MDSVLEGCEIQIRPSYKETGRHKTPRQLVIYGVDHHYRQIMNEMPSDGLPASGEDVSEFSLSPGVAGIYHIHIFCKARRWVLILVLCRDATLPMSCLGVFRIKVKISQRVTGHYKPEEPRQKDPVTAYFYFWLFFALVLILAEALLWHGHATVVFCFKMDILSTSWR